jgi:hypothetical protein
MRPPLVVLNDLSAVLSQLDSLAIKRSKLIRELTNDPTVRSSELADFLQLAKLPDSDITQVLNDFEHARTV